MRPSDVSFRLRAVARAISDAPDPSVSKVLSLLARIAEDIPQTRRSPRAEDWVDVDVDVDEPSPPTRSPDLEVRSRQFVSDMEAGVRALSEIVRAGPAGRESDMREELELVQSGAEGLSGLL